MKKVVYLVLHLGFGGVEKAVANQANILCNFCDVEIISAYKLYETPPFYIDSRVKVKYLMNEKPNKDEFKAAVKSKNPVKILKEGLTASKVLLNRTRLMKKALKDCGGDIIISTRYLYNALLAENKPSGAVTIAQEHRHHNNDREYIENLKKSVENLDYFMPVSRELTDFYAGELTGKKVKCLYIPHNLDTWPDNSDVVGDIAKCKKELISVGRLSPEKGFPDLIDVFAIISKKHPEYILNIIGDGDDRAKVEAKIHEYNLEEKVVLHGFQKKDYVNKTEKGCAVYMMASLEESFGIVLIEAQSFGIPCVAFSSAQGAAEIIKNGENGFLIDNRSKEDFADKVCELLETPELYGKMSANARKNAETYTAENIGKQWQSFIANI